MCAAIMKETTNMLATPHLNARIPLSPSASAESPSLCWAF